MEELKNVLTDHYIGYGFNIHIFKKFRTEEEQKRRNIELVNDLREIYRTIEGVVS